MFYLLDVDWSTHIYLSDISVCSGCIYMFDVWQLVATNPVSDGHEILYMREYFLQIVLNSTFKFSILLFNILVNEHLLGSDVVGHICYAISDLKQQKSMENTICIYDNSICIHPTFC